MFKDYLEEIQPVVVPVDWRGVERERGHVALAGQGTGKVVRYVPRLGKVNCVPAHLGQNVLSSKTLTVISNLVSRKKNATTYIKF